MSAQAFHLPTARMNAGLSQRQLAQRAGVSRETVQRLEEGRRVRPGTAKKIADLFAVQVTDLMPIERESA